jgi:hypothetical protein
LAEAPGPGFGRRLALAARQLAGDPRLLWALAAVFWARVLLYAALLGEHEDARGFWSTGHALLTNPAGLYPATAAVLAAGRLPSAGIGGSLQPPPVAFLAAPFALLPIGPGAALWVVFELIALALALIVLERLLVPGRLTRPALWLVAGFFPPLFSDLYWGQRGGQLLLLAGLSMLLVVTRPILAGALAGLGTALKFFPAALAAGVPPGRRLRYWGALAVVAGATLLLTFIPFGGPVFYLTSVLIPDFQSSYSDCGLVSTPGLFRRGIGGEGYPLIGPGGAPIAARSPVHMPELAAVLLYLTLAIIVGAAVWAAWRSGWASSYGMALGYSLGALIPGEVYTYQMLPLLPLLMLVLVRAGRAGRWWVIGLLAVALLAFVREPCRLPFPNIWTIGALAIFFIAVTQHSLFRADRGKEPPIMGTRP